VNASVSVAQHARKGKTQNSASVKYYAVSVLIAGVALEAEAVSKDAAETAANKIRKELGL
jgi:hypothetical protein